MIETTTDSVSTCSRAGSYHVVYYGALRGVESISKDVAGCPINPSGFPYVPEANAICELIKL